MKVVVAGGGVAGLEAVLALRELAEERVELWHGTDPRRCLPAPCACSKGHILVRLVPQRVDLVTSFLDTAPSRVHDSDGLAPYSAWENRPPRRPGSA